MSLDGIDLNDETADEAIKFLVSGMRSRKAVCNTLAGMLFE